MEDYEDFLKILGPCGLNCGKCLAFAGGDIQRTAEDLKHLLGDNFAAYASRFSGMDPVFTNYPVFSEFLDHLTGGTCKGCRKGECLFKACQVKDCIKEKEVDFCFQCDQFPCDRHGFPEGLEKRWQKNNRMMKELGMKGYYERIKDEPRYP